MLTNLLTKITQPYLVGNQKIIPASVKQVTYLLRSTALLNRICKVMGIPVLPVLFCNFFMPDTNMIYNPGGIVGMSALPCLYINQRYLSKEHFHKLAAVMVYGLRHHVQDTTMSTDYESGQAMACLRAEDILDENHVKWHAWREVDARAYQQWFFDGRKKGASYVAPPTDNQLLEIAQGDSTEAFQADFVRLVKERYVNGPAVYIEWFGNEPTFTI